MLKIENKLEETLIDFEIINNWMTLIRLHSDWISTPFVVITKQVVSKIFKSLVQFRHDWTFTHQIFNFKFIRRTMCTICMNRTRNMLYTHTTYRFPSESLFRNAKTDHWCWNIRWYIWNTFPIWQRFVTVWV